MVNKKEADSSADKKEWRTLDSKQKEEVLREYKKLIDDGMGKVQASKEVGYPYVTLEKHSSEAASPSKNVYNELKAAIRKEVIGEIIELLKKL